jgi:hypothetical protein
MRGHDANGGDTAVKAVARCRSDTDGDGRIEAEFFAYIDANTR